MTDPLDAVLDERENGAGPQGCCGYSVTVDSKGKVLLPVPPEHGDVAGMCGWLTCAFNLEPNHRVTGGRREGLRGPEGHVVLTRSGAPTIRFEPASRINNPTRLIETLSWQTLPTDGAIHALTATHCRDISYVIRMLCGVYEAITEAQEAEAIVADLMSAGEAVEGHITYGTTGQRYEAAVALRRAVDEVTGRKVGPYRYLVDVGCVDERTGEIRGAGEIVVAVSDLQETARRHVGSSLAHGWLDGRMAELGWARICLEGYGQPGRAGRKGPHARIHAYRGLLPARDRGDELPSEAVNT